MVSDAVPVTGFSGSAWASVGFQSNTWAGTVSTTGASRGQLSRSRVSLDTKLGNNDYNLSGTDQQGLEFGDTQAHRQWSLYNLINLYESWNKPEEASEWRAKLPQTEAVEE
jgi:hypothetical protein